MNFNSLLLGQVALTLWKIPPLGTPQYKLYTLWADAGPEGQTLIKFSRHLNNALALASLEVKKTMPPGGGWSPSVVIQG